MTADPSVSAGGVGHRQERASLPPDPHDHPAKMGLSERAVWGALAAGVGWLAFGVRRGPLSRLALASLGGGLATLAISGRSPLYDAIKLRQNDQGASRSEGVRENRPGIPRSLTSGPH